MSEFKSVFAPRKFFKYSEISPGTILTTGVYQGSVEGTFGLQHIIKEEDGTEAILNKTGHLTFLLERAGKGSLVQVVYLGQGKVSKGKFAGKASHQFDVRISDTKENTNE
jgi:hypothetical protein